MANIVGERERERERERETENWARARCRSVRRILPAISWRRVPAKQRECGQAQKKKETGQGKKERE